MNYKHRVTNKKKTKHKTKHKTKNKTKNKTLKKNSTHTRNFKYHNWPYYKTFITQSEIQILIQELKNLEFTYSIEPYKPFLFNRRTPIISSRFKGQYTKFIDPGYLKYDILPLIYSEPELVKCQFRNNPTPIKYFNDHKNELYQEFIKSHPPNAQNLPNYREFLFSKVKQCNNFRPTLALQTYQFLNINPISENQSILDFSAGWGDRLFAACVSNKKYIGLDPNTNNTHIYNQIINNHGNKNKQCVITTGAEYLSIPNLRTHMTKLGISQFDLIFTSPPFFDYEIYADKLQSISNYNNYQGEEKWLCYFLFNVIQRFTPLLKENGYIGIYIQDVGKCNYLEPLGLFCLSFANILGLTVSGIISSTRLPFIVLQKIGTQKVYPYTNPDNNKTFNIKTVNSLFKSKYPIIYQYCLRLMKLQKYKLLTPVSNTNNKTELLKRSYEKIFMQLDLDIKYIVISNTLDNIYNNQQKYTHNNKNNKNNNKTKIIRPSIATSTKSENQDLWINKIIHQHGIKYFKHICNLFGIKIITTPEYELIKQTTPLTTPQTTQPKITPQNTIYLDYEYAQQPINSNKKQKIPTGINKIISFNDIIHSAALENYIGLE